MKTINKNLIIVALVAGLMLVGCRKNTTEISSTINVTAQTEIRDSSNNIGKQTSRSAESRMETKGEDMAASTLRVKAPLPEMDIFNFVTEKRRTLFRDLFFYFVEAFMN